MSEVFGGRLRNRRRLATALSRVYGAPEEIAAITQKAEVQLPTPMGDPFAWWLDVLDSEAGVIEPLLRVAANDAPAGSDIRALVAAFKPSDRRKVEVSTESAPPQAASLSWKIATGSWAIVLLGIFAFVGFWARNSQSAFLGIPEDSHQDQSTTLHADLAYEGVRFAAATIEIALEYAPKNILAVGAFVLAMLVLLGASLSRQITPPGSQWMTAVVLAVALLASVWKLLWYDVPTLPFKNVLSTLSFDTQYFDVSQLLAKRTDAIWNDVVCSRIYGIDNERVRALCGEKEATLYTRRLMGRYLNDLLITMGVIIVSVTVGIQLLARSKKSPHASLAFTTVALTITVLSVGMSLVGLPLAYSRTTRSTEFPYSISRSAFIVCVSNDRCFTYAGTEFKETDSGEGNERRDILKEYLKSIVGKKELGPPPEPLRLGKGKTP